MTSAGPRVALYIHRLITNPTGIQRYAVELANALSDLPVGVTLVTGSIDATDPGVRAPLHALDGRVRLRHLGWTALHRPFFENVATGFDLVHASSTSFPIPTRKPLVVTIHDLLPADHPEWYPPREQWAFRRAMSYAVDHAEAFIVPSAFVRDSLVAAFDIEASRVTVVAEGVAPGLSADAQPRVESATRLDGASRAPYVVAVGGLIPRKNLDVVIDAIAALPACPTTPRLLIVGEGPEMERLAARARAMRDPSMVQLLGRVDDARLSELLGGALGLVHPALFEGFGLTTIESMAAGIPVLAAKTGAIPEVVGDAAVLLAPDDADAWADALARLSTDDDWREELRIRGRARSSLFSWSRAAAETDEVYQRVLAH